jgi:aminoglycoside 6'-N-acetyltransferase
VQVIDPRPEESHYCGNVPGGLRAVDIWIGKRAILGKGYKRLGFGCLKRRRFGSDDCFVYRLSRAD